MVFMDIFRSHDMGGVAKALWVIFIIILPFLGVFVYLIARGGKMHERAAQQAAQQQKAFDEYVRQAAGTAGSRHGVAALQARRPQVAGRHHRCRVRGTEGQDPGQLDGHFSVTGPYLATIRATGAKPNPSLVLLAYAVARIARPDPDHARTASGSWRPGWYGPPGPGLGPGPRWRRGRRRSG